MPTVYVTFEGGGGSAAWTPDTDVEVTQVVLDSTGVDVSVSTDKDFDVNFAFPPGAMIWTQLIALFSHAGSRDCDAIVRKGDSIYFSADSTAVIALTYKPVETDHVV